MNTVAGTLRSAKVIVNRLAEGHNQNCGTPRGFAMGVAVMNWASHALRKLRDVAQLRTQMVSRRAKRQGLTLLETVLALAILGVAMAAIGELTRIGARSAVAARELTQAQLHCESVMAEITAGVLPPEPVQNAPMLIDPDWLYTIELAQTDEPGLAMVRVTVLQNVPPGKTPLYFTLTRWIIDPGVELPEELPAQADEGTEEGGAS